ncbi:MAG: hypothetical protein DLM69_07420 [Candidatus Chloroheliales bacterium]|nr:MAG: hypothetical protein DLM69_07420 [Chloroflexota bacterium]
MSTSLPSVPLMHLNGPATLWWELPQTANDPPHGWLRLSILHVLPDALHAQWQPLDDEYTRRYAALYNEAKDEQAEELRRQHEARWNEFAAQQHDFHFFFASLDAAQQFAAACLTQTGLSLTGPHEVTTLPPGKPLLCPQLELTFDTATQRSGLFGLSRQNVATCTLALRADPDAASQPLNPTRVVAQAEQLRDSLAVLAATEPAALRDERAIGVVERVLAAAF